MRTAFRLGLQVSLLLALSVAAAAAQDGWPEDRTCRLETTFDYRWYLRLKLCEIEVPPQSVGLVRFRVTAQPDDLVSCYQLSPDPRVTLCPPGNARVGAICYPVGCLRIDGEVDRVRFDEEYVAANGTTWLLSLHPERGTQGTEYAVNVVATVRFGPLIEMPAPAITVTEPRDLIPGSRRVTVRWTVTGKMDSQVRIDLLRTRGDLAWNLLAAAENDGEAEVRIPAIVPAGSYRLKVQTLDGRVEGLSEAVHVPPAGSGREGGGA